MLLTLLWINDKGTEATRTGPLIVVKRAAKDGTKRKGILCRIKETSHDCRRRIFGCDQQERGVVSNNPRPAHRFSKRSNGGSKEKTTAARQGKEDSHKGSKQNRGAVCIGRPSSCP